MTPTKPAETLTQDRCSEFPDDLAVLAPGPGLAAALAAVDLAQVPNDRILEIERAQNRQLCHEQARMAAVLAQVGRCAGWPEPGEVRRLPIPERFGPDETRAALCWTRRAADGEHELAEKVVEQWPAVFAAWWAGDIDRPRVRVFDRFLTGLSSEHVTSVCQVAVPRAAHLTTGQLAVLLRRMVIAVGPDAAARWYRKAVAERNVIAYAAPDGTITLTANGLPPDQAEAACVRLQDLASRAKRAGHPGPIGQIRCDLFLGMLDGRFHHLTNEQVIAALLTDHRADEAPTDRAQAPGRPRGDDQEPVQDERVGIEIRVGLATLLGLDEHPAEIPGLGLLLAPDARRRVGIQRRAQWRFALADPDGRLVFDGITRRRPRHLDRNGPPGGIVELHIPLSLLTDLAPDGPLASGDWADLLADITAQHVRGDDRRRDLDARPHARLPAAALRRHTEIRDRTCTFIGCRRRAHSAEQDHTRDYDHGGTTVRANLGPLCPHDHQLKHRGGWRVDQPEPGTFIWHSPLGGEYRTAPQPILPSMPLSAPLHQVSRLVGSTGSGPDLDASSLQPDVPILCRSALARAPDKPSVRPSPRRAPDDPPPF